MNDSENYGKYFYFRKHDWEGGWGVRREGGKLIALTFDKGYAKAIADSLNNDDSDFLKEIEKY